MVFISSYSILRLLEYTQGQSPLGELAWQMKNLAKKTPKGPNIMKNSIFNEKKSILKKRLKQPTLTHTYSQAADSQLLRKALKNQSYKADSFKDYPIRTHSLVRAKNAAHDPAQ